MPDKKLTDSEIVKALECCHENSDCGDCMFALHRTHDGTCVDMLHTNALDLINRLQAEVEKQKKKVEARNFIIAGLKAKNERLEETTKNMSAYVKGNNWGLVSFCEFCKNLKAEAHKEFAELVKKHSYFDHKDQRKVVAEVIIDHYLKELVGEDNG